jgi:hypothetical protein
MGHEVEAGFERAHDRIRGQNQLTTSQARPTVNLTDPVASPRFIFTSGILLQLSE